MNHPDYDPSDRCNVCQVKGSYHTLNDDGTPSGEVRRVIDKFGYNVAYDHEFVRMPGEDYDDD